MIIYPLMATNIFTSDNYHNWTCKDLIYAIDHFERHQLC
jgi:hypothetical protein